jgi:hypothetical protein
MARLTSRKGTEGILYARWTGKKLVRNGILRRGQTDSLARMIVRLWGRKTQKVRDPWEYGQTNPARKRPISLANAGFFLIFSRSHELMQCVFRGG